MGATYEKLENNRAKVTFHIPSAKIEEGKQAAYQKNKGKFRVPGFRPGKAPRKIIEQTYGEMVFFEDAFDQVFSEAYSSAVDELSLFPVSRPQVDIEDFAEDGSVKVVAEIDLKPEVELGEYLGLEVEKPDFEVKDEDVEKEIERLLDQNAGFEEVDRPAQMGDRTTIDYAGSVDGVAFEGGTAQDQMLELGSNMFIPGFEEQIVGMSKGDSKDINVTFPEDYRAENLAGKDAVFAITLKEIKTKLLPELDDEFAKDVSEFETLAELREDTKNKLTERAKNNEKHFCEDAALKVAVDNAKADIPDSMVDNQVDRQIQEMAMSMMYQGLDMEGYLKYTGLTMEELRDQQKPTAREIVKTQLTLEAIIKKENIQPDEKKVDEYIQKMAERTKKDFEEYKKTINEDMMESIRERSAVETAIELIAQKAKYVKQKAK